MKIVRCQQGSGEWFAARAGRITASEIVNVMATLKKGGETSARAHYREQIHAEIVMGEPVLDGYLSKAMRDGTENEPLARAEFEMRHGVMVDVVGFVIHPQIDRAGCSPDGIIGNDGGVELKAPKPQTHLRYCRAGTLPEEYEPQVMWNIACCEREWWDFASFNPLIPSRYRLFTAPRTYRNDARIAEMEAAARIFLDECDEMLAALNDRMPELPTDPPEDYGEEGLTAADVAYL